MDLLWRLAAQAGREIGGKHMQMWRRLRRSTAGIPSREELEREAAEELRAVSPAMSPAMGPQAAEPEVAESPAAEAREEESPVAEAREEEPPVAESPVVVSPVRPRNRPTRRRKRTGTGGGAKTE